MTVEENVLAGGFGSAVLEHLSDSGALRRGPARDPLRASPTATSRTASPTLLHEEIGLTPERIAADVAAALESPACSEAHNCARRRSRSSARALSPRS